MEVPFIKSELWKKRLKFSEENMDVIKKSAEESIELLLWLTNMSSQLSRSEIIHKIEVILRKEPWKKATVSDIMTIVIHFITCYIISSDDVKILRCMVKLVNKLRTEYSEMINTELAAIVWMVLEDADSGSLKKVSNILDIDVHVRPVFQDDVSRFMKIVSSIHKGNFINLEYQHLATKLSLQTFLLTPNYPHYVCQVLTEKRHDQAKDVKNTVQSLVDILFSKEVAVETSSLAGTSIVMTINTLTDPQITTQIFTSILNSLDDKKEHLLNIGEIEIKLPSYKQNQTTVKIIFLKGIIMCCSEQTLCHVSQIRGDKLQVFMLDLFPLICNLCDGNEELYLCFQLFSLWFKQLVKLWPVISINRKMQRTEIFTHATDRPADTLCPETKSDNPVCHQLATATKIVEETIKYVWMNLESPVDDVPQYALEILQCLLHLGVSLEIRENICESLLDRCLSTPWNVRSRYKPLQILIPFIDLAELQKVAGDIKHDLLRCMSVNYLVPHASDVYRAFLQSIVKTTPDLEKQLKIWIEIWRDLLMHGVLSNDMLICNKVNIYWIPLTLKLLPSSGEYLQEYMTNLLKVSECVTRRQKLLLSWCVIVKNIRNSSGIDIQKLNDDVLRDVLLCEDEDVRMEGLALICNSNKKAESLRVIEINILKEFLPLNLRVDSAPFRQLLGTNLQRLLVRVRDSCSSFLKKTVSSQQLETSIDFIEWLHCLLISNLLPGVSFQRRKSCLDNLDIMYQVILSTSSVEIKGKRQLACSSLTLVNYAKEKGLWDFFNHRNAVCLIHCLLDGADEIRESAYNLLQSRYTWSFNHNIGLVDSDVKVLSTHLLAESLRMCNKPKASDSHSGALLCRLVFNKFACLGLEFKLDKLSDEQVITCVESSPDSSPVQFLHLLLNELEDSIQTAVDNPVYASQFKPIHGITQALMFCINDVMSHDHNSKQLLDETVKQVVTCSVKIIDIMLSVMAGGKTSETCLSFAELGSAIETMVTDGVSDNTVLSPEFQCLLSWCWVNLKTCCTCLGDILSAILNSMSVDVNMIAVQIRDVYLKVLTNCRHRGAIEGCRNGLLKFCLTLMNSTNKELKLIPNSLLLKVFYSLENSGKMASVTRRSAGLPIIVHVLAVAAKKNKENDMITDLLNKLIVLASEPIPCDWDQRQDLPAVHALNILKAVFGDSSLSSILMPLYSKMVILVIESFESQCWAIRNAASQLFSTLMLRMFGSKGSGSCLTLEELSVHYPELPSYLLKKLDDCVVRLVDQLHPSLFLVLTILSSLSSSSTDNKLQEEFRRRVNKLLCNPIYSLRELSSLCMVALVSLDKTNICLHDLINQIPTTNRMITNYNQLHGHLLSIEKILQNRNLCKESANQIIKDVISRSWFISTPSSCRLLSLKYCQIINYLVTKYSCDAIIQDEFLSAIVKSIFDKASIFTIGVSLYQSALVDLLVVLYRDDANKLLSFYKRCLQEGNNDVRSASLLQIQQSLTSKVQLNWNQIQDLLWKLLQWESYLLNVKLIFNILNMLKMKTLVTESIQDVNLEKLRQRFQDVHGLQHYLITFEATILVESLKHNSAYTHCNEITTWCDKVVQSSKPDENEDLRIASVKALTIAGHVILKMVATNRDKQLTCCVVSLLEALLCLIDEEDTNIRKMAASFISQLNPSKTKGHSCNSNFCIQILFEYICDKFYWSEDVFSFLALRLYKIGCLQKSVDLSLDNQNVHILFDRDEDSFFSERILRFPDIHRCLRDIVKKNVDLDYEIPGRFSTQFVTNLTIELSENLLNIENNLKEGPVINTASSTSVLMSLTGVLLLSNIIIQSSVSTQDNTCISKLKSSVELFVQIKYLHPWFSQLLDSLL